MTTPDRGRSLRGAHATIHSRANVIGTSPSRGGLRLIPAIATIIQSTAKEHCIRRRTFLGIAVAATLVATKVTAAVPVIEVYKSPTCGCCGKWVEHLRTSGFAVNVHDIPDVDAFRAKAGVPAPLAACHTALVGSYVVEGHVPAADIWKLLAERPKALGLAAPGMPAGAPGMDASHAGGYDVMLFQADGRTRVYHAYSQV